jgi:hypothetical protein
VKLLKVNRLKFADIVTPTESAEMITNPENLSKDRLKAELRKRGIEFNSQENKRYYVDLYRKKVFVCESVRSEFSDDDTRRSPGLKKKVITWTSEQWSMFGQWFQANMVHVQS